MQLKKLAAIALLGTVLSACGGGGGDDDGNDSAYRPSTGASSASAAAISHGRALYAQYCYACHGVNMRGAKNSNDTLNAIARNKGGMGSLSSAIRTVQADDIAAYLAFGL